MGYRGLLIAACCLGALVANIQHVSAEKLSIAIVVGEKASEKEQFAAEQLQGILQKLGGEEVSVGTDLPENGSTILLGNPTSNSSIPAKSWSKLSKQGITLKSIDLGGKPAVVVGGGSDAATLWAAYELGHQLGVRYMLRGDVYPQQPVELDLSGLDITKEPDLKLRSWETLGDSPLGFSSWSLEEYRRFLGQLAKFKFNHLLIALSPSQPFVHYEYQGVKKQTAELWNGEQFPIARDAPGRTAFGSARKFENPDFAGLETYEEKLAAGKKYVQGLIDEAHRLGMKVSLSISPLEFPAEFDDPANMGLVKAKLRAYLETYSNIDGLTLRFPKTPQVTDVEQAWKSLVSNASKDLPSLDQLAKKVPERKLSSSGTEGIQSLKGNISALAVFNQLFRDTELLKRPEGESISITYAGLDPELLQYANSLLPKGVSLSTSIDSTTRRVVENQQYLESVSADAPSRTLELTLASDELGVLSKTATRKLESLVALLLANGWSGFSAHSNLLTELDPAVHFLSRAAWDSGVTARSDHDDLFATITGSQSVADRLWYAFGHIENATELIDQHQSHVATPVAGMLMDNYQLQPIPPWWEKLNEHYTQAMIELYRSHDAAAIQSRPNLFYWAKRSEYVLEYFSSVQSVRAAATALSEEKDSELALEQLETAIEQLYNALDTLSDIARDQGDRALIAVLNSYAYRPLMVEYEKLLEEVESTE